MVGLKIVDDYLNKSFYKLGLVVGRHPGYFLIVPTLITILGMTGYQKIHNNIDPEYLFSPINGPGKYERAVVESFFKTNYSSRFDVSRITRAGRFGRVIITAKDGDKNMLRSAVWDEMRLLDDLIQNMTVQYKDEYFTYQEICAKWMSDCFQNDILNLDYLMDEIIATWSILAYMIFLSKTVTVKFQQVMTELNEYMRQRQMPEDLRKRMNNYYNFKYQRVFFNESLINTVLSRNLKKEINTFLCKFLIQKSLLLQHLSARAVTEVINYVIPEIYLNGDTIMHAGGIADCMYFLAHGSVAIYTASGREVCHLHDGAYFGEISLIMKNTKHTATVVALEISKIYRLDKKHFEHCFMRNPNSKIYKVLLEEAEQRIKLIKDVEEIHQKIIFEETYALVEHDDKNDDHQHIKQSHSKLHLHHKKDHNKHGHGHEHNEQHDKKHDHDKKTEQDVETGAINLTFPLMLNPKTLDLHAFPVFFGGTQVSEDGLIISVPSVQLVYFGNADSKKIDTLGAAWEDAFLDLIEKIQDKENIFKHIRIARFSSRTLDHELEKNTKSVIPYFTSTFVTMAVFSIVTCMMTDWVRSKPWLGLLGNLSAAMATLCAFGFCMYAGVDFIGINLAAPFLMIGIGIDDTFVMLAAWRRTSIKTPVPERMAQMLSEAAVSITITSVTDFFSFWIGIFSPFPSVTIFCIYSGAATCLLFIWHLTFFAACVAISGYCEQKNLHSVFCFKVQPLSKSRQRCWLYRAFCAGGVDPNDTDNPVDNKEHGFMVFFRDYFANFLSNGCVKFLVILVFAVYLLGAGYGITQIEEGLERRKVAKNDSYAIEFFDREDDYYREFPYRVQVIVSGKYDYSDPKIQWQIENLTQTFENTSYVSNTLYTDSWLRSFLQYVDRNQEYININIKSQEDFSAALKELWLTPSSPLSLDVKFDEKNPDEIVAMRFLIQVVNISGTEHEKEMVRALRKICQDSPLNVTVFHPYFVFFDQFELVRPLSIQNMIIGAGIMMLVSFIFIPNILCAFWVAFSIISIEMGVVGYMALWHVNLDSISMINLIMCIGFSVDFTAHICYAYMSSPKKSSKGKMKEALYALGVPIFQGSVSTILGMLALILANNYIFAVFFKMIFLVVFLGAMHGLFLLPVLLSLFGPGACTKYEEDEEHEFNLSKIEKSLPHPYCIPHPQFTYNGSNLSGNLRLASITPMERYNQKPYKGFGEMQMEKDLGLGTSEENSSQSSTNSKKNEQNGEISPERHYNIDHHRRNSESSMFQARHNSQINIYGEELYRPTHRQSSEQITRFDEPTFDSKSQYYRRRYSPPESRGGNLVRSSSQHNVHHNFLKESRFP